MYTTSLGGLVLLPLYSLEQTKAAVLRHAFETAKRLIRHSHEYSLADCLTHPYRVKGTGDEERRQAYSIAYICHSMTAARQAFERDHILTRTDNGEIWIELKQNIMLTILREISEGRGRLVMRVWYYWPKYEKQPRVYGGQTLDLHSRICEEGSLGEFSGAGSGSGSDMASGGSGTASGCGSCRAVGLGELRGCATCLDHHDVREQHMWEKPMD